MSNSVPISNRRRSRINYTTHQLEGMEALFAVTQYPDYHSREALADAIDLTEARIHVGINRNFKMYLCGFLVAYNILVSIFRLIFAVILQCVFLFYSFFRYGSRTAELVKNAVQ